MQTKLKVTLIAHTPDADKLVAAAAKLCYAKSDVDTLMDNLTAEKVEDFIERLAELGHQSPIEHASYTFAVEARRFFIIQGRRGQDPALPDVSLSSAFPAPAAPERCRAGPTG